MISEISRGTPSQPEFHFSSCFAVQVDIIMLALGSAMLVLTSFRSICKHCRLCRGHSVFKFYEIWAG